jgi:hypothetical protein
MQQIDVADPNPSKTLVNGLATSSLTIGRLAQIQGSDLWRLGAYGAPGCGQ